MGSSVGVRAHRERVASAQAGSRDGSQVSHIRGVPDMEKELTRMSPVVLDWSWRGWTWIFSQSFALANTVVMSNFAYRQLSQGICK